LIHPISTASEASHGSYNAHVRVVSILVMKIETEQLQLEVRRGVVELGDALLGGPLKGRKVERRTKRISENTPAAQKAHGFADVSYIMPLDVHVRDAVGPRTQPHAGRSSANSFPHSLQR
jgi:hypothetical protein